MTTNADSSSAFDRAFLGAVGGAAIGLLLLAVGAIRIVFALLSGVPLHESLPALGTAATFAFGYCGAFALAGAALGALWPMRRSVPGAFGMGFLGAAIVSGTLTLMLQRLDEAREWRTVAITVTIMTLVFGCVAGYQIWRWDRK